MGAADCCSPRHSQQLVGENRQIDSKYKEGPEMNPQRLYRSRADHMIAGICGGLALYFAIDVTLVRLFFVLAAVFTGGLMILIYFVMWLVIPEEPAGYAESLAASASAGQGQTASGGTEAGEPGAAGSPIGSASGPSDWTTGFGWSRYPSDDRRKRRHQFVGWGLLILGALILMSNLNLFNWLHLHDTWPLFLILAGLFLLLRRRE